MNLSLRGHCLIYGTFFLLCFHITAEEYGPCPAGFDLSCDEEQNDYICYKLKGPETFKDKYVDCEDNIYTLDLHFRLNITRHGTVTYWIDYSSLYPGGPFVNLENKTDVTSIMENIAYDSFHNNKTLCLVVTNMDVLTAVECDEMHNRYCFVKSNLRNDKSKPLRDRRSFKKSIKNICLLTVNSTSNITWIETKSLCDDKEVSQVDIKMLYRNITKQKSDRELVGYAANHKVEPEELIDQVLHDLKQLLEDKEDPILIKDLSSIFDQVNCLMDLELDLVFPDKLIRLLHELGPRVDLPDAGIASVARDNIALEVAHQNPAMLIWGIKVYRHDKFITTSFGYILSSNFVPNFDPITTDVVVTIPESIIWSFYQFNFLVFRNDTVFHDPRGKYTVNSRVININLNLNIGVELEDTIIDIYLRPLVPEESNVRRACVRWLFSDDETGSWTEDDCTLIRSDDPQLLDTCKCNLRFTYYAEALTLLTVEELVEQLVNNLRLLLEGQGYPLLSDVDHVFDQMNYLNELDQDVLFPDELLHLLQKLGPKVDISPDSTSRTVRKNTAMLIFVQRAEMCGISVARSDHGFTEDTFEFIPGSVTDDIDIGMFHVSAYDAVLTLPTFVWRYTSGVSFIVFQDDRVLYDNRGLYTIISRVISFSVTFFEEFEDETKDHEIDLHLRPLVVEQDTKSRLTCVRWLKHDNGTSYWSEEGCKFIKSNNHELLDTCKCNVSLTYYAMALTSKPDTTTENSDTTTVTTTDTTTTYSTSGIIMTPEEQIEHVMEVLNQLLNQTAPILVNDISEVFDQVDDLLNLDQNLEFPSQMLQLLEELGMKVDLDGLLTSTVVRNSIGLMMADVTENNPVRGVIVASRDTDEFTQDTFAFLIGEIDSSTLLNVNVSEAVVSLPLSVTRYPRRISFVVYRNAYAFSDDPEINAVNSRILSISVGNHTQFENGEVVDIHLRPTIAEPNRDERRVCAYWRFLENQAGYWSQDGCTLIRSRNTWSLDICRCDHLTHFAEILIPRPVFSQSHENALEILSLIGCLLSIFGLIIIILTAILFRSWRKNFRNQIWLQLCIALFLMSLCFVLIAYFDFDDYRTSCIITGIALHYSTLASFCWMLVVAVKSYNDLVLVFIKQIPRKRLIASGFSWGLPVLIIGILLAVNPKSYSGHFEDMNPSGQFCYPSDLGMWLAVYMPIGFMLLANWTIFILIIRQIGFGPRGTRTSKAGDIREALACIRLSFVLIFLFGLPWVIGLFTFHIIPAYLFTCMVTTQGFVLFMLIVCGNSQTRNLWLSKLKRKQHKSFTVTSNYL